MRKLLTVFLLLISFTIQAQSSYWFYQTERKNGEFGGGVTPPAPDTLTIVSPPDTIYQTAPPYLHVTASQAQDSIKLFPGAITTVGDSALMSVASQGLINYYFVGYRAGAETSSDTAQVQVIFDEFIDTNWSFLAEYFDIFYSADSVEGYAGVAANDDSVLTWWDYFGNWDLPKNWTTPFKTARSARKPYVFYEPFSTGYRVRGVHCENQHDPHYVRAISGVSDPVDIIMGLRIKEGPDYEKWIYSFGGFYFDDNGPNNPYTIGWSADDDAPFPSEPSNEVDRNEFIIMRVRIASNVARVWFNDTAHASGAGVTVSSGLMKNIGIFGNGHHQNMELFFLGYNFGTALTAEEIDSIHTKTARIIPLGQLPWIPSANNITLSTNGTDNTFTADFDYNTGTGGTINTDSTMYVWYHEGWNSGYAGNSIDKYEVLDTLYGYEGGQTIDCDNYPGEFPDESGGYRLFVKIFVYDDVYGYGRVHRSQRYFLSYP